VYIHDPQLAVRPLHYGDTRKEKEKVGRKRQRQRERKAGWELDINFGGN